MATYPFYLCCNWVANLGIHMTSYQKLLGYKGRKNVLKHLFSLLFYIYGGVTIAVGAIVSIWSLFVMAMWHG